MHQPDVKIDTTASDDELMRPFLDLTDSGLLWLVNAVVFHPRGVALALRVNLAGEAIGWQLMGDGTEPWSFAPGPDVDAKFAAANATIAAQIERARIAGAR